MWEKYDYDNNSELDKEECRKMTKDILLTVGKQYNREEFNRNYIEMDTDGNGLVDKEEMTQFLLAIWNENKK